VLPKGWVQQLSAHMRRKVHARESNIARLGQTEQQQQRQQRQGLGLPAGSVNGAEGVLVDGGSEVGSSCGCVQPGRGYLHSSVQLEAWLQQQLGSRQGAVS
jgi:hypothetical protein